MPWRREPAQGSIFAENGALLLLSLVNDLACRDELAVAELKPDTSCFSGFPRRDKACAVGW